jgi:hypothetical protein
MIANCPKGIVKKSPSAGVTSLTTGSIQLAFFIPKWKTSPTIRQLFGSALWADPFSFSDFVNVYQFKSTTGSSPLVSGSYGLFTGDFMTIVYEASGSDVMDPITGNFVPAGTRCFIDSGSFQYDIGDAPIRDAVIGVQTALPNTLVPLVNHNRALLVETL